MSLSNMDSVMGAEVAIGSVVSLLIQIVSVTGNFMFISDARLKENGRTAAPAP
jgi:hypothetical protein